MPKVSMIGLVGLLTLVALAGTARAEEAAATPIAATSPAPAPASTAPPRHHRFLLSLSFLPMSLGKFTASYGGMRIPADAAFAPGVAPSVGYQIIPRYLTVGLTVQTIFNVGSKEDPTGAGNRVIMATEYDFMARVVASFPLVETISIYAEALPGYSLVMPSEGDLGSGFVLASGGGVLMDLSDWMFVNLGAGYQWGFQSRTGTTVVEGMMRTVTTDVKTEYYRVALGVGWKF